MPPLGVKMRIKLDKLPQYVARLTQNPVPPSESAQVMPGPAVEPPSVIPMGTAIPTPTPEPRPLPVIEPIEKYVGNQYFEIPVKTNRKAPPGFKLCPKHNGGVGAVLPNSEFYTRSPYCRDCLRAYNRERVKNKKLETARPESAAPGELEARAAAGELLSAAEAEEVSQRRMRANLKVSRRAGPGERWCPRHDDGAGAWIPKAAFHSRSSYCQICSNAYAREKRAEKRTPEQSVGISLKHAQIEAQIAAHQRIQDAFTHFERNPLFAPRECKCCGWDGPDRVRFSPNVDLCQICMVGVNSVGYCAVHHYGNNSMFRPELSQLDVPERERRCPDIPNTYDLWMQDAMNAAYKENAYRPIALRRAQRVFEALGKPMPDEED